MGKYALSSPFLPPAEQGRRAWAPAAVFAGGPGHGDGRDHGEQREGGLWGRLPPSISVKGPARGGSHGRSEERRVGKECYALCRSRWSPYH